MSNLEQIKEISFRMRDLREIHELSEESLAVQLGIDVETYKKYEGAQCDIPIGFLYEVASRFKVSLTALLTGDEPRLHIYEVVKKDQGLKIDRRKQYDYRHLAYNFIGKKMEPFKVRVPASEPDFEIKCSHHEGQEFNFVLEGRLKIVIGGHELILEAGDALYFDATYPHGMKALDGKEAEFLAIIAV